MQLVKKETAPVPSLHTHLIVAGLLRVERDDQIALLSDLELRDRHCIIILPADLNILRRRYLIPLHRNTHLKTVSRQYPARDRNQHAGQREHRNLYCQLFPFLFQIFTPVKISSEPISVCQCVILLYIFLAWYKLPHWWLAFDSSSAGKLPQRSLASGLGFGTSGWVSVQSSIFKKLSSTEAGQNSVNCSSCVPGVLKFGTEAIFERILVPPKPRFPGKSNFSWTRILVISASVPKNMKNEFSQARIS